MLAINQGLIYSPSASVGNTRVHQFDVGKGHGHVDCKICRNEESMTARGKARELSDEEIPHVPS